MFVKIGVSYLFTSLLFLLSSFCLIVSLSVSISFGLNFIVALDLVQKKGVEVAAVRTTLLGVIV